MNILTAEEVYNKFHFSYKGDENYILEAMKEFAKMHVEAALKLASENAEIIDDPNSYTGNTGSEYPPDQIFLWPSLPDQIISEDSILNAYPLTNIK